MEAGEDIGLFALELVDTESIVIWRGNTHGHFVNRRFRTRFNVQRLEDLPVSVSHLLLDAFSTCSRDSRKFSKSLPMPQPGLQELQFVFCEFVPYRNGDVVAFFKQTEAVPEELRVSWITWLCDQLITSIVEMDEVANDFRYLLLSEGHRRILLEQGVRADLEDGRYRTLSQLGFSREAIVERIAYCRRARDTGLDQVVEAPLHYPDGWGMRPAKRPVRITVHYAGAAPNGNGVFFLLGYDLSATHAVQAELAKERDELKRTLDELSLLQLFFSSSPVRMGIIKLPADGSPVAMYCNMSLAQFLRCDEDDLQALTDFDFLRDPLVLDACRDCRENKHTVVVEIRLSLPEPRYLLTQVNHLRDDEYAFLCEDVTTRRLAEHSMQRNNDELQTIVGVRTAALESALAVKERFMSVMSHEMRTPLGGIITGLSILAQHSFPADVIDVLEIAQVCGEQLNLIISDVLEYTRMEEMKIALDSAPFHPYNACEEALQIVSFSSDKGHLELICDIDDSLPDVVKGDGPRLRQVLLRLLSNAAKFSHYNGEVILRARADDSNDHYLLSFSVEDNGIGISEAAKQTLFQPFSQADQALTRRFGGTGIGLSICKKLIEKMGGNISVESSEGLGSKFFFSIRVGKATAEEYLALGPSAYAESRTLVTSASSLRRSRSSNNSEAEPGTPPNAVTLTRSDDSRDSREGRDPLGGGRPGGTQLAPSPSTDRLLTLLIVDRSAELLRVMSRHFAGWGWQVSTAQSPHDAVMTILGGLSGDTSSSSRSSGGSVGAFSPGFAPVAETPGMVSSSSGATGSSSSSSSSSSGAGVTHAFDAFSSSPIREARPSHVPPLSPMLVSNTASSSSASSASSGSLESATSQAVSSPMSVSAPVVAVGPTMSLGELPALRMSRSLDSHPPLSPSASAAVSTPIQGPPPPVRSFDVVLLDTRMCPLSFFERVSSILPEAIVVQIGSSPLVGLGTDRFPHVRKPIQRASLFAWAAEWKENRRGMAYQRRSYKRRQRSFDGGLQGETSSKMTKESSPPGAPGCGGSPIGCSVSMPATLPSKSSAAQPAVPVHSSSMPSLLQSAVLQTPPPSSPVRSSVASAAVPSSGPGSMHPPEARSYFVAHGRALAPSVSMSAVSRSSTSSSGLHPIAHSTSLPSEGLAAHLRTFASTDSDTDRPSSSSGGFVLAPSQFAAPGPPFPDHGQGPQNHNGNRHSSSSSSVGAHSTPSVSRSSSSDSLFLEGDLQILVAEDNMLNQRIIKRVLESIGRFNLTFVENGRKAVDAVNSQQFDIILMDVMMPELDGCEATRIIRTLDVRQPRIIAVTANAFDEQRDKCLESGMDDFIPKPIDRSRLAAAIRHNAALLNVSLSQLPRR